VTFRLGADGNVSTLDLGDGKVLARASREAPDSAR
jgi:hypothetical protein